MKNDPPRLSPVVRSVVLEAIAERLPHFRDEVTGEIDDRALAVAVMAKVEGEQREIAKTGKREAWAVAVYELVRYFERTSTKHYVVVSREQKQAKQRAKSRQRMIVTFRNAAGVIVKKDRAYLLKGEVPFVRKAYAGIEAGAADVVAWCDAVWEQMELRGLGDDVMVSEVLTITEEAA